MVGDTGFALGPNHASRRLCPVGRLVTESRPAGALRAPSSRAVPHIQISVSLLSVGVLMSGEALAKVGGGFKVVGHIISSWNRLGAWLQQVEGGKKARGVMR